MKAKVNPTPFYSIVMIAIQGIGRCKRGKGEMKI